MILPISSKSNHKGITSKNDVSIDDHDLRRIQDRGGFTSLRVIQSYQQVLMPSIHTTLMSLDMSMSANADCRDNQILTAN